MKIIQIILKGETVFGLGNDNKIYIYNTSLEKSKWVEYEG